MRIPVIFLLLTVLIAHSTMGQTSPMELGSVEALILSDRPIDRLGTDNAGHIFVTDLQGNIIQYDSSGDSINNYSPAIQGRLSHLETGRTSTIFTFSKTLQRIEILDRFLAPLFSSRFENSQFGYISAASLGNNNRIWLFDQSSYTLLLWDYQQQITVQEIPLNLIVEERSSEVLSLREHKNLLFINMGEQGVYILDNQGNLVQHLTEVHADTLTFMDRNLLSLETDQLIFTDYVTARSNAYSFSRNFKLAANQDHMYYYTAGSIWRLSREEISQLKPSLP
ncbi:hypothetical protein GCM10007049_18960 [Echinicola pacifica]|uniref:Uncharacterized protein n=1 Tax=Echinicola pacifica TaxID=346377 RepID=A0A918PXF3_9BACT|nr:hypothetical protein [Echinicola pacifica]GGZ26483.1 hypothetical protein GCM10007049_18960 [Echinicola pacifica]